MKSSEISRQIAQKNSAETPERRIWRFDEVEIDVVRGRIQYSGEERHLRQKAFSVLVYLIEHRESVVTKEDLIRDVWNGMAVVDDVLVQCIKDIRRTLEDNPHRPRFIRTIPKVGYRFIGEVHFEQTTPSLPLNKEEQNGSDPGVALNKEEENVKAPGLTFRPVEESAGVAGVPAERLSAFLRTAVRPILGLLLVLGISFVVYKIVSRPEQSGLTPAPNQKVIAVMYFTNQSGDPELDWMREGLTDMLITNLSRSEKLNALSRSRLRHLLTESPGTTELDRAMEAARKIQAEAFLIGSFVRIGTKVRIDVHIYETKSGQVLASEALIVDRVEDILTDIDLLSYRLLARLGVSPLDSEPDFHLARTMTNNLEAYRYYMLGLDQTQALHTTEAIAHLEKAVALDPEFAMAYARIGYVYAFNTSDSEKGKPYLQKAFELSDRLTQRDQLAIRAWYAVAAKEYKEAIAAFQQIIKISPQESEAYWRLGRLLAGEGEHEKAIRILKRGLAVDPQAKDIYNVIGGLLWELGRDSEAIAMMERYVALVPNESNAYDSLGLAYQNVGQYQKAVAQYNRALELKENFEVAIVHLANTRFQQGRYREALDLYQQYIRISPSDLERGRGYGCLSVVYLRLKNYEEAEKNARLSRQYSKYDFAIWKFALERDRALAQDLERQFADTVLANRGRRFTHRIFHYARGVSLLKQGKSEESLDAFREALKNPQVYWEAENLEDCLGRAYLQLKRPDDAIAEFHRILQRSPNYPLAHFHLAQAYEMKKQPEQAYENYSKFLQVWRDADRNIPEVELAMLKLNAKEQDAK
jgi:tetratricopeptide (TPR) repeat protein/DNA-binding winged helix-turn-helix (wHTH) protein